MLQESQDPQALLDRQVSPMAVTLARQVPA